MLSSRRRTGRGRGKSARKRRSWWLFSSATIVLAGLVAGLFVVTEEPPVMPDPMAMERSSGGNSAGASLVSLPADDAPHDDVLTEWWYYNGHLRTKQGKRYSFHYVIFLRDTLPIHTVAHVSLTDHKTGRHYTDQKRTAGNPSSNTRDRFNFNLGQWVMAGAGGNDTLKVETPNFAFDLSLTEGRSPVMHGGSGLLDFEQAGASYYYSRTRMNATGKVWLQGKGQPVTGQIWFDHQWGDFKATMLGWDWFAFQLDDGTDIMLYQLRDAENRPFLHSGTIIQNGQVQELSGDDFQTKATGAWTSKATGIKYPMGWRVRLPGHKLNLKVAPVIRNSEFDARATTYNAYWEGAVRVTGSHSGVGFVELGGYSLGE